MYTNIEYPQLNSSSFAISSGSFVTRLLYGLDALNQIPQQTYQTNLQSISSVYQDRTNTRKSTFRNCQANLPSLLINSTCTRKPYDISRFICTEEKSLPISPPTNFSFISANKPTHSNKHSFFSSFVTSKSHKCTATSLQTEHTWNLVSDYLYSLSVGLLFLRKTL